MAIKEIIPSADFDWEAFENDGLTAAELAEQTKAYEATLNNANDYELVDGTVEAINDREVFVNIGYRSTGVIARSEFSYCPELAVGDTVEVYIESQSPLILSHKKARQFRLWERVNAALDNNEIVKGFVKRRTKGGMIVDVFGTEAFLPGSQIDVKPVRDYDTVVGKVMKFKIVKIDNEFRNVVVSHKAVILENDPDKCNDTKHMTDLYEIEDTCLDADYEWEDDEEDDYIGNSYDEEDDYNEVCPSANLLYTHGRLECPSCGAGGPRTYIDGTAKCCICHKWFRYWIPGY